LKLVDCSIFLVYIWLFHVHCVFTSNSFSVELFFYYLYALCIWLKLKSFFLKYYSKYFLPYQQESAFIFQILPF
jgi:hypothetical protein